MSSATSNVKYTASRAADSKPLEYVARAGFVGYGIIHLLFAWIAFQVAFPAPARRATSRARCRRWPATGAARRCSW